MLPTGRSIIDKLIDGLVADMESWILARESSCNGFGRPFESEFLHDIPAYQRIPDSPPLCGVMFTLNGSLMCSVGQVTIVDRRFVPLELS